MHVAVPVVAVLDLILFRQRVREIADDIRLLEFLVVDRDQTHALSFEIVVDVDADSHALDVDRLLLQCLDVLFELVEVRCGIEFVDICLEAFKSC